MTEPPRNEGPLQFGRRDPGLTYRPRPCAYGVAVGEGGRLATVRVTLPGQAPFFDLPGGGLESGEDEGAALVREFGEETGLTIRPGRLLVRAGQYMRKSDGEPVDNGSGLYAVEVIGEQPGLKIETDHELLWLEPLDALRRLRHDSHAFAVAAWLRTSD